MLKWLSKVFLFHPPLLPQLLHQHHCIGKTWPALFRSGAHICLYFCKKKKIFWLTPSRPKTKQISSFWFFQGMSVFKGPSHRAQTVQVRFVILTEAPVYVDMTRGFYSKQDPLSAAVPSSISLHKMQIQQHLPVSCFWGTPPHLLNLF